MPLSSKTLDSIQAAGAAAFKADTQLKAVVKDYATQVQAAMSGNPFDIGNDSLFEEWKSVCRLSQAVAQIEMELKKIHASASNLPGAALSSKKTRALPAPVNSAPSTLEVLNAVEATDAVIKKPRKLKRKTVQKAKSSGPLPSNATVLLAHLATLLNQDTFMKVNQSSIAVAIKMPKGSIGASMSKLVKEGFLAHDPTLGYKLTALKN